MKHTAHPTPTKRPPVAPKHTAPRPPLAARLYSQLAIALRMVTFGTSVGGMTARVIGEVLCRWNHVAIALRSYVNPSIATTGSSITWGTTTIVCRSAQQPTPIGI